MAAAAAARPEAKLEAQTILSIMEYCGGYADMKSNGLKYMLREESLGIVDVVITSGRTELICSKSHEKDCFEKNVMCHNVVNHSSGCNGM